MSCKDYLAKKNKHIRDKNVIFDEKKHIYTIKRSKSEYISVTTLVKKLFPEFDSNAVISCLIKNNKKYIGKNSETIKKEWQENGIKASQAGTKLHNNIELYSNGCKVEDDSKEFKHFLKFLEDHPELEPYRTEWMVYDNDYKIAGSIDMVYKNNSTGKYYIFDWKRVKQLKLKCFNYKDKGYYPVNDIPNTNSYHYFLQLYLYKYLLEKNYDIKIEGLYLCQLYPTRGTYKILEAINMEKHIEEILRIRKMQINNNIDKFQLPQFIETTDIDSQGKKHKIKKLILGNCIFPFKYKNKIYNDCVYSKKGKWCATKLTKKNYTQTWGYCKTLKKNTSPSK